jgi:hypothetical protein
MSEQGRVRPRDLDNRPPEQKAEQIMSLAAQGSDISGFFTKEAMGPEEQRQILTAMRGLQKQDPSRFGNVELVDSNNDGILDDAKAKVKNPNTRVEYTKDIMDTHQDRMEKLEAKKLLDQALSGHNVYRDYNAMDGNKQTRILNHMRAAIDADRAQFGDRGRFAAIALQHDGKKITDLATSDRAGRRDAYMTDQEEQQSGQQARPRSGVFNERTPERRPPPRR